MSNTRRAEFGSPFRQERFASSADYQRGLMANLVVKRTEALRDPEDRKLIWALQLLSHEEGGFQKVAEELVKLWPERIASPTMQKIGTEPTRIYTAEQVRIIRPEIQELWSQFEDGDYKLCMAGQFPLFGEHVATRDERMAEQAGYAHHLINGTWSENARLELMAAKQSRAEQHPKNYPASVFVNLCGERIADLPSQMERLCLNPEIELASFTPYFFPTIVATLREYVQHWIADRTKGVVMTEIGRIINEVCDYTVDQRIMSLIDGQARTGKTFQAKVWCAQNPGAARYVQVPSSNDEVGFYRAIARAIGVSINLNSKAHHLRDRIEDVLQSGQLTICFDEAHFLWPTSNYRGALPKRIAWICTALVNHGVPVVLITTPQFFLARGNTVERSSFNCDQFDGRLMHYEALPDRLSKEDLSAVARSLLPEGSDATITGLVSYAQASAKYLAGIFAVVTRARFLAKRDGRPKVQAGDVRKAMAEGAIPSDKALAVAVKKANDQTRPTRGRRALVPVEEDSELEVPQGSRSDAAEPLPRAGRRENFTGKPAASIGTHRAPGLLVPSSEEA